MRGAGLEALFITHLEFPAGMWPLFVDAAGGLRADGALQMHTPGRLALRAAETDTPRCDLNEL